MTENTELNDAFEAMSAMQKEVRRNNPRAALEFAMRVEEFNPVMLWNRLEIIVCEDIGPADHTKIATIHALREIYERSMDSGKYGGLFLSNAIQVLASGPKSWDSGSLINIIRIETEMEGKKLPIPEYAYDKHTLAGKKMGRGVEYFFDEGIKMAEDKTNQDWIKRCRELCVKFKSLGSGGSTHTAKAINKWKSLRGNKSPQKQLSEF